VRRFESRASVESSVEGTLPETRSGRSVRVDARPIRVPTRRVPAHEYKFLKTRLEDDPDLNVAAIGPPGQPRRGGTEERKDLSRQLSSRTSTW